MRPFNLEEYLANPLRKVVTRDGREVRIICTDRKSEKYPIGALITTVENLEVFRTFTKDGIYNVRPESPLDLFFAPEKKEGWVNIYKNNCFKRFGRLPSNVIHSSEAEAKDAATGHEAYITTVKIEWEE